MNVKVKEITSWLWPMHLPLKRVPVNFRACHLRTPRTLYKWSERFHTWGFVPVRNWEKLEYGSWQTHLSFLWPMDQLGASTGERPCYKNEPHQWTRKDFRKPLGEVSFCVFSNSGNSAPYSKRTAQNNLAYFLSCFKILWWDCVNKRTAWFRDKIILSGLLPG